MKDAFEKLFRAVHQFKKLNVSDLIPGLSWRRRPKHFRRLCRAHCADWRKKDM